MAEIPFMVSLKLPLIQVILSCVFAFAPCKATTNFILSIPFIEFKTNFLYNLLPLVCIVIKRLLSLHFFNKISKSFLKVTSPPVRTILSMPLLMFSFIRFKHSSVVKSALILLLISLSLLSAITQCLHLLLHEYPTFKS